jgi:hypothetical protein
MIHTKKLTSLPFAPPTTSLQEMVSALGARWHIEEDLEATKDLGLEKSEVRSFTGWYRHITLVMRGLQHFLLAFAYVTRVIFPQILLQRFQKIRSLLSPLPPAFVRHLLARLFFPLPSDATRVLAWSAWRRRHQYLASQCHTKARENRRIAGAACV